MKELDLAGFALLATGLCTMGVQADVMNPFAAAVHFLWPVLAVGVCVIALSFLLRAIRNKRKERENDDETTDTRN